MTESAPVACSLASLDVAEPTAGTAPQARAWVCLEQPGAWGRAALTDSGLDQRVGAELDRRAGVHGVRTCLVRRPGSRPTEPSLRPQLLVASTHPAASWLLTGQLASPADVLTLDWAALAAGDRAGVQASLPTLAPDEALVLLVCTNGARDTCCALQGRPVVLAAAAQAPDRVWEVTHVGGHRFAPTTVLLPSGHLHGRVLDGTALLRQAAAGRLRLTGLRGRSTWAAEGQVAEVLVRNDHDVVGLDDLEVLPENGSQSVSQNGDLWAVHHRDGRSWRVRVVPGEPLSARPPSCGKTAEAVRPLLASYAE